MYRILLIIVTVVVIGLAIGYGLRSSHKTSAAVTSLLPRETVAFLHVPDLESAQDQWHHSDIYELYREPAVQDFLRKPLSRVPKAESVSQTRRELEQLNPKDVFLAVTSVENDNAKVVAGFRFAGSEADAEKIVGRWREKLMGNNTAGTVPETTDYEQHKIQVYRIGATTLATVYAGHWFLGSNSVDELKALVDRADGRATDKQSLLNADPNFREAMDNMPASYAICSYLQPKTLADKLSKMKSTSGQTLKPDQANMLAQIRSVCGTTRFDGGKMHDVFFAGMPQQTSDAELTRNSIALASTDSFIYLASLLNIPKQFALVDPSPSASFLGARLQRIGQGLAAAGITAQEWTSVFGSEMGASADWRSDSHWPAVLGTFPVKDFAKAKQIAVRLAWILDDDGHWTETDKNGVHYIATPYTAGFVTLRPTIAVSERFMVGGFDTASVEAAMERASNGSLTLSNSAAYKKASHLLPEPTTMFAYLDLGLLYTRLDATLRPMLLMGAAFMPAMNDYVEVAKLPPAELVAKHLTPVVSSQRYHGTGYIAESIGPLTLSQTALGAMFIGAAGAFGYQHSGLGKLGAGVALPTTPRPHVTSSPASSPLPSAYSPMVSPTPVPTP